jgi:hypothetical protein
MKFIGMFLSLLGVLSRLRLSGDLLQYLIYCLQGQPTHAGSPGSKGDVLFRFYC